MNAVIASSDLEATLQLQGSLTEYVVTHFDNAETMLLEIGALQPRVIVVHDSLRGVLPAPDVAALLSRRAELSGACVIAAGQQSQASAFYSIGLTDFEAEPFEASRFKARLEATMRVKEQQLEVLQRLEQLESKHALLLEDQRLKDRLTHMLVHDLKNPLGAVMGTIDFVLSDNTKGLTNQQRQLLEMSLEESNHLLQMTTNILDVRKMRDGKLILQPKALSKSALMRLIGAATEDVGTELKRRQTQWRIADGLPVLHADAEVLRRVFANLISNAVKHTRENGRIQLEARVIPNGLIEIAVHDNGEGIPQEDLERIFNDFERSRVTNTTRFDTGMGLAFCKLAVEQHGGRIWARSERGRGSSFFFTLPLGVLPSAAPEDELVELLD